MIMSVSPDQETDVHLYTQQETSLALRKLFIGESAALKAWTMLSS